MNWKFVNDGLIVKTIRLIVNGFNYLETIEFVDWL